MYLIVDFAGAFSLYDLDNDGHITRDEMVNIVDAIYCMVGNMLDLPQVGVLQQSKSFLLDSTVKSFLSFIITTTYIKDFTTNSLVFVLSI